MAFFRLFQVLFGALEREALFKASFDYGAFYIILVVIFFFFILLNMFLAIIMGTYEHV